jgi:catechol 2,3-dioxygenase-like lactoylglutathione lyase family enzyme
MDSSISHVNLNARDLSESVQFYVDLLDAEPIATPNVGCPSQWLAIGSSQLRLSECGEQPISKDYVGITVDDLEPVYYAAERRGAFDSQALGHYLIELPGDVVQLYVRDPAGNVVAIAHDGIDRLSAPLRTNVKGVWELHPQSTENMRARLFDSE